MKLEDVGAAFMLAGFIYSWIAFVVGLILEDWMKGVFWPVVLLKALRRGLIRVWRES